MTCVGNLSFVARTTQTSQIVRIRFWSCSRILLDSAFACTMAGHRLQLSVTAPGAARICQRNPASLNLVRCHRESLPVSRLFPTAPSDEGSFGCDLRTQVDPSTAMDPRIAKDHHCWCASAGHKRWELLVFRTH